MLSRLSLRAKLILPVAALALGALVIQAYALMNAREVMTRERIDKARSAVSVMLGQVSALHERARKGELTLDEAMARAKDAIRTTRYDRDDYFTMFHPNGVVVAHPLNRALEGTNRIAVKDTDGVEFNRILFEKAVKGGGVVSYRFPRPSDKVPVMKTTYGGYYAPLDLIVATGVYLDDVEEAFRQEAWSIVAFGGLVFGVIGLAALLIQRDVTRALLDVNAALRRLAQGDLSAETRHTGRSDEIGDMARALAVFRESLVQNAAMAQERGRAEESRLRRVAVVDQAARDFEGSLRQAFEGLTRASQGLVATASDLSSTAGATTGRAAAVTSTVDKAASSAELVASATEQMSASIGEIDGRVALGARTAKTAVAEAQRTAAVVEGLNEASDRIGNVVGLIRSIADQTNLLALNATIEAARAGEVGKGFAVVASEVKTLATQTAKATEEISQQVEAMQRATVDAVGAIGNIAGLVGEIDAITATISAAVTQQSAATGEIAVNCEVSAACTHDLRGSVDAFRAAASETERSAHQVQETARGLVAESGALKDVVDAFLAKVRAA